VLETNISKDAGLHDGDVVRGRNSPACPQDLCRHSCVKYLIFEHFPESLCEKCKICHDNHPESFQW
jgi:hypothetical protein